MATMDHAAMRAIELYRALKEMGPDTDRVARVSLRTMDGAPVGDLVLSAQDVERLLAFLTPDDATRDDEAGLVTDIEAYLARGGEA